MNKKTTGKKIATVLASLLFACSVAEAQAVIYTENFDASTSLPTGWSAPNGGWIISTTNSSTTYANASGVNNADIDNTLSTTGSYDLVSKPVSTVGYTGISAKWGARVTNHFADSGSVVQGFYWSSNNGTTWNQLTYTENPTNSTWAIDNGGTAIALPAGAANQAAVLFKWTVSLHHSSSGTYRIDDFTVQGTASTTGINEITESCIKAYSFNKTLFIQLQDQTTGELKIYSLNGTEVYNKSLSEQNHKIDLSALTQGVYVIKIQTGSTLTTKKIIID